MLSRFIDANIRIGDGSCIVAQDSVDDEVLSIGIINSQVWIGDPLLTKEEDRKPNASVLLHQDQPVWSIKRISTIPEDCCSVQQAIYAYVRHPETGERSWNEIWNNRESLLYR